MRRVVNNSLICYIVKRIMRLQSVKGFKDYLPQEAIRRQVVLGKIIPIFQKFGFDPLETPTLEYEETLTGKYGEEERLIYKFETAGGDKVALKYDQTVPLARVVAQYGPSGQQTIPIPFKRYQVQSAYRGENTQKGRYREFLQCDADTIGVSTPLADAEILALATEIYKSLGLDVVIKINDRSLLSQYETKYLAAIDKLDKIGKDGVIEELVRKGLSDQEANQTFERILSLQPSENLQKIINLYTQMGYSADNLLFESTLVRGLDYYTGMILEVVLKSAPTSSSLGGGGRWDTMIKSFTGQDLPAVGFSVGIDRTIEAMEEANVLSTPSTETKVLVTIFSSDLENKSLEITSKLRSKGISAEMWLNPESKMEKQLKYADKKGIPYVVILGPDEATNNQVTIKDLKNRTQQTISIDEAIKNLS